MNRAEEQGKGKDLVIITGIVIMIIIVMIWGCSNMGPLAMLRSLILL